MVNNKTLLIACLVWSAAVINILRIGIIEYPPYLSAVNFLLSAAMFIAVSYTGLGAELTLAGILFGKNYVVRKFKKSKPDQ